MERRVYSLPVKAAIPSEAIRYSDVQTRVEIASEVTPVVNFRNANIKVLYEDLGISLSSVGRAIGLSMPRTRILFHEQGVAIRSVSDPINIERRMAGMKRFYADPVKAAEKNARVHAPEATRKQGESLRRRYSTDPEFKKRQLIHLENLWSMRRIADEKRRAERIARVNERSIAERDFASGLLNRPEFRMLSPRQKQVIELRFRTDGGPALTLEQVGEAMGGISRQAVQQHETNALVKLGILKKFRGRKSQKIGA